MKKVMSVTLFVIFLVGIAGVIAQPWGGRHHHHGGCPTNPNWQPGVPCGGHGPFHERPNKQPVKVERLNATLPVWFIKAIRGVDSFEELKVILDQVTLPPTMIDVDRPD